MCVRACIVTLTVLLVESPQLDLVGFVLGLLLQPAGPGGERGGGGRGGRVFHHQSLEFINRQHTHNLKASCGFPVQRRLLLFFPLRLPCSLLFILKFILKAQAPTSQREDPGLRPRRRTRKSTRRLKGPASRLSPVFVRSSTQNSVLDGSRFVDDNKTNKIN